MATTSSYRLSPCLCLVKISTSYIVTYLGSFGQRRISGERFHRVLAMQAVRESILAMATGAGAGGAASYFIARGVWQGAQAQGDAVDSTCAQLQQLRDFRPELPPKVPQPQARLTPPLPPSAHHPAPHDLSSPLPSQSRVGPTSNCWPQVPHVDQPHTPHICTHPWLPPNTRYANPTHFFGCLVHLTAPRGPLALRAALATRASPCME